MILKYKGGGIFILQARNIVPDQSYYTQQLSHFLSTLFVDYIIDVCDITPRDFIGHEKDRGAVKVSVITKKDHGDFIVSMGFITSADDVIRKCDDTFDFNETIYLAISPEGLSEIQNTGETYMECEEAMYTLFEREGMIKKGRVLPPDYPFLEPPVREKKFSLYKTTRNIKEALIVYNAAPDEQKILSSDKNGLYGVKFDVYGEDLKKYKTEFMCEDAPFKSKMEPFTPEMAQELISLYL